MRMTPGNRHVEPIARRCQAVLEAMRGRFDAAREVLAAARETLHELGHTMELQELNTFAGIVELLAGAPVAAESHLRQAHEKFVALGVGVPAARAGALLARALLEQGREDEAMEHTRYAEQHAAGDLKTMITWCGVRAEVLARRGDHASALTLAHRAVELAEPTDALADTADAAMTLARVLRVTGRPDEASAAVEQARALYEAKGHTVGVGWTRDFTLTPGPARQRLAAALTALGDRAPGRFVAQLIRRWATGNPDAVVELYTDDVRLVDHSNNGWGELRGLEQARRLVAEVMTAVPDTQLAVTEKLDGDERVLAFTGMLPGSPGGPAPLSMGFVIVVESGLLVEEHIYEPEDLQEIHAEYARLGGRPAALGDRAPERAVAAFCRPWSGSDLDELVELFPPDIVAVDPGGQGYREARGRDALREAYGSALETFRYVYVRPDEVLACDDRVLAVRATVHGMGKDGAGELSTVINYVLVVEDGWIRRLEQLDGDGAAAALARYAALGGSHDGLGKRPPERLFAELLRRSAAGENVRELYSGDFAMVDHRSLGWEELTGPEAAAELVISLFGMAAEMSVTVDDVIACDDRVMAVTATVQGTAVEGGGALVLPLGYVIVIESDLLTRTEFYEPEERLAMVARYAELGGGQGPLGDRPPERLWAEYIRLSAARDLDRLAGLIAENWVLVDHRTLGWQESHGHEGAIGRIRSGYAVAADVRLEVDEVLACDERVIAMRTTAHGTRSAGRDPFDLPAGIVSVVEGGRIIRRDQFDYDDVAGMLAMYAELGGQGEAQPATPQS
jgi:tetratricopeptide (TPR) repeat protein